MKKKNLIIILSVAAVLIIIVGVMAALNSSSIRSRKELQDSACIIIKKGGEEIASIDMEYISSAGEEDFQADLDTSETDPEEHLYSGVPLIKVLNLLEINMDGIETVIVRALDGYTVAFDISEAEDEENMYIAYKIDGQYLKDKSQGGLGPYQIITRKDPYSQRWCKFVMEIDLQ
ncbi:MAG TPA: hypothetical protein DCP02_06065 [Actinobacteria bacterium]|nr:hypothetical protein [Actinomycetota bacterium]